DLDIITGNSDSADISILENAGDGTFDQKTSVPADSGPKDLLVADFDADGRADLVVLTQNGLVLFGGESDGSFSGHPAIAPTGSSLSGADFDGDGDVDLVVLENRIQILWSNGDSTFLREILPHDPGYVPVRITGADLDGDGLADLAIADRDS